MDCLSYILKISSSKNPEGHLITVPGFHLFDLKIVLLFDPRDPVIKKSLKNYAEKFEENKARREMEERRKFPLEQRLKEYIVGQEGAITTVASAIRR